MVDGGNDRVCICDTCGVLLRALTSRELSSPYGVGVCEEGLVVSNRGNHSVVILRLSVSESDCDGVGQCGDPAGVAGSATHQLAYPHGVACVPSGEVFVRDSRNRRVVILRSLALRKAWVAGVLCASTEAASRSR